MTQYLVAIHHPDDYDQSVAEDEAMSGAGRGAPVQLMEM